MFPIAITLWAAEVWQKPFTEWSEKDIAKIMTDSPWSHKVDVTFSGGGFGGPGGGGPTPNYGATDGGGGGGGGGGKGGGKGGGGGGGDVGGGGPSGPPSTTLMVRWRTALVLNEALAKHQFGAEAATSPDAKKMLQPQTMVYVIWIDGIPGNLRPQGSAKEEVVKATTLGNKEKMLTANDLQFSGQGRNIEFYYVFPRDKMFTPEDKEIEFVTKIGKTAIKAKFKLKDMEVDGKLDL